MAGHPYTIGAYLFSQSKLFELDKQHRSKDPVHTEVVESMYQGKSVTMMDLRKRGYKHLVAEDMCRLEWQRAPVLVATNQERYTLTHERVVHFARANSTVVF